MNVFELAAVLTLNNKQYTNNLAASETMANKFGTKVKKAFSLAGKVSLATVTATTAAIVKLTKTAISAYGEYEQLAGGVETLFGASGKSLEEFAESEGKTAEEVKDEYEALMKAQNIVTENASQAYKNQGLSANKYMETVTSFAASLIQSCEGDTVKAAELADIAITDMSDNSNKMGTNMESIQNAYAGFAKSNYTMLDNLKLGYGGTEAEMERLLETASEISGIDYDIDSYADVVEAIHVIQENMGISGTTASEAVGTMEGSLKTMQSAWENLTTEMGKKEGNVSEAVENFADSASNYLELNLLPAIGRVLGNVPVMISTLGKELSKKMPDMESVLDAIPTAVGNITEKVREKMPSITTTITENLPQIAEDVGKEAGVLASAGLDLVLAIVDGVSENIGAIIISGLGAAQAFLDAALTEENIKNGVDSGKKLIASIVVGINDGMPLLSQIADEVGVGIFDGIMYGITGEWSSVNGSNLVQKLFSLLTGDVSPSSTLATWNKWWDENVWGAVNQGTKDMLEILDKITYPAKYNSSSYSNITTSGGLVTNKTSTSTTVANAASPNVTVTLTGDAKKFFDYVVQQNRLVTKSTGVNPLLK